MRHLKSLKLHHLHFNIKSHWKIFTSLLVILFFVNLKLSFAQINSFFVAPNQTNVNYEVDQDPHLVIANPDSNINKLFLFIGGTGSKPDSYQALSNFAGNLGFDVINLTYLNSVATVSLADDPDSLVFRKYRQEICYGTPVSSAVNVDTLNSIYTRTIYLLNYLDENYPDHNWGQFLIDANTLDWSKIVVAGHSQGSGHACYFGKMETVDRVIMFSGPNDYHSFYSNAAEWLRTPGITEIERQYAYLSLLDEVVDFDRQLSNLQGLNLYPSYDTTCVDNATPPYGNSRCLYTTQPPGIFILNHNSPVRPSTINTNVWEYLLKSTPISQASEIVPEDAILIFPNPTNTDVNIEFNTNDRLDKIIVYDINGKIVLKKIIKFQNYVTLDLSNSPGGIYFVRIKDQTMKIIKY